jgi:hypothetical protein
MRTSSHRADPESPDGDFAATDADASGSSDWLATVDLRVEI